MHLLLWLMVFLLGPVAGAGDGTAPALASDIVKEVIQGLENLQSCVIAALTLGETEELAICTMLSQQ